ncbi:MAG: Hsp70 family protein [Verrucomicrobia bacterium]|nr:Hsp70 family protein [Verrucomicrobiota bacterium]
MRKDDELHAEEDRRVKKELETRNEAEHVAYRTERLLKDNQEKISAVNEVKVAL